MCNATVNEREACLFEEDARSLEGREGSARKGRRFRTKAKKELQTKGEISQWL
jgi:hypothetical protein